ncbi:hypothetical protein ACFQZI_06485 [Mucilaginibacter lutimaris]|uniref:DUF4926 domain-containing protein n=1 Tax=Mucilaginibacter lutimaris TaxID=931629 RepID=A0ABW2ZE87_9SPHI
MTNKELLGTLVLVHPDLENHPAGREGDIGIVAYIDEPHNEIYLRFTDEAEAIYPSDALFLLKDREHIFSRESGGTNAATLNDYKNLFKIATLQDLGRSTDIWNALEIARDNPEIWPASLVSIEESLGLRHNQYISR